VEIPLAWFGLIQLKKKLFSIRNRPMNVEVTEVSFNSTMRRLM